MTESRIEYGYSRTIFTTATFALAPVVSGTVYVSPPIRSAVSVPSLSVIRIVTEPPADGVILPSFSVTVPYKSRFVELS